MLRLDVTRIRRWANGAKGIQPVGTGPHPSTQASVHAGESSRFSVTRVDTFCVRVVRVDNHPGRWRAAIGLTHDAADGHCLARFVGTRDGGNVGDPGGDLFGAACRTPLGVRDRRSKEGQWAECQAYCRNASMMSQHVCWMPHPSTLRSRLTKSVADAMS